MQRRNQRLYYQCYKDWWADGRSTKYMKTYCAVKILKLTANVSPAKPHDPDAKPIDVIWTEWAIAHLEAKKAEQGQT